MMLIQKLIKKEAQIRDRGWGPNTREKKYRFRENEVEGA